MLTNLEQACVRRRAILSVRANPMCPDEAAAERAVNEVWESCFGDTRPFDEVSCARLVVAPRRGGAVHFFDIFLTLVFTLFHT
jgi:hypothetical protein